MWCHVTWRPRTFLAATKRITGRRSCSMADEYVESRDSVDIWLADRPLTDGHMTSRPPPTSSPSSPVFPVAVGVVPSVQQSIAGRSATWLGVLSERCTAMPGVACHRWAWLRTLRTVGCLSVCLAVYHSPSLSLPRRDVLLQYPPLLHEYASPKIPCDMRFNRRLPTETCGLKRLSNILWYILRTSQWLTNMLEETSE